LADDQINLVKQANDIVEVIAEYGINLIRRGRAYKGLCPFHDDHRPSMDVDQTAQRFTCWACQKKGDVFDFVQEKEKVGFAEALRILAERAHIELKQGDRSLAEQRAKLLDCLQWAAEQYHQSLYADGNARALTYLLHERRLTHEIIEDYGIGYAPAAGHWLLRQAKGKWKFDLLQEVGLAAESSREVTLMTVFGIGSCFRSVTFGEGRSASAGEFSPLRLKPPRPRSIIILQTRPSLRRARTCTASTGHAPPPRRPGTSPWSRATPTS